MLNSVSTKRLRESLHFGQRFDKARSFVSCPFTIRQISHRLVSEREISVSTIPEYIAWHNGLLNQSAATVWGQSHFITFSRTNHWMSGQSKVGHELSKSVEFIPDSYWNMANYSSKKQPLLRNSIRLYRLTDQSGTSNAVSMTPVCPASSL